MGRARSMKLRYVQRYIDRHGKERWYFRRPGHPKISLPAPGSPGFDDAYVTARAGLPTVKVSRDGLGSVSAAIAGYYQHRAFRDELAASTQSVRRAILERFRRDYGDLPIGGMKRQAVAAILGKLKPNPARDLIKSLRGVVSYCIELGLLDTDPLAGMKPPKAPKTGGYHTWTEGEIAKYEAHHPIGSRARLAEALLLHTALRRSDIVRLGPQHIAGDRIELRKTARTTGKTLRIAVAPALARVLDATACTDLTYLVTNFGSPFTAAGFGNLFREYCNEAGLPHCSAHGLRKAMLRRVAEAGGSTHHLKGVGGHATMRELDIYTADVDQERMAKEAIELVGRAFPDKTGT